MTAPAPVPPAADPSWLWPIAVGSLSTVLLCTGVLVISTVVPGGPCLLCCSAPAVPVLLAWVPIAVALRRDPWLTPGQGFALAFIAVGTGAVVAALAFMPLFRDINVADLREQYERAGLQENERLAPAERDRALQTAAALLPYAPAILAAMLTLLGGICGLFVTAFLRRRAAPPAAGDRAQ